MQNVTDEFKTKFSESQKSFGRIQHPVWSGGHGPPVILMHELDGFIPAFMKLVLRLSDQFTVHAPVFYGKVGQSFVGAVGSARAYFCMRKEFEVFRLGRTSPIAGWVRELAKEIHQQSPQGSGVGVVGMCMTGGIVLATISHPSVAAAVAAQPSLPLAMIGSKRRKKDLGMNPEDVEAAAQSTTPVLLLRYGQDRICPALRIPSIRRQLPNVDGPPDYLKRISSHPTLTDIYREGVDPDTQAISEQAVKQTVSFLSENLN